MSGVEIRVTLPVLEALIEKNEEFVVKLSHAAAREIAERHGSAIISATIVQEAIAKIAKEVAAAREEAGKQIEGRIGEWDQSSFGAKYRLRACVVEYIESQFREIAGAMFEKWLSTRNLDLLVTSHLREAINIRVGQIAKQSIVEFLKR